MVLYLLIIENQIQLKNLIIQLAFIASYHKNTNSFEQFFNSAEYWLFQASKIKEILNLAKFYCFKKQKSS